MLTLEAITPRAKIPEEGIIMNYVVFVIPAVVWMTAGGLGATKLFPVPINGFSATASTWAVAGAVTLGGLVTLAYSDRLVEVGMKTWRKTTRLNMVPPSGLCPACGAVLSVSEPVCSECGQITGV